jgi:hypothetical protein
MKTSIRLHCRNSTKYYAVRHQRKEKLLRFHDNEHFYIVDSYMSVNNIKGTRTVALLLQQWLGNRATMLRHTYTAYIVASTLSLNSLQF